MKAVYTASMKVLRLRGVEVHQRCFTDTLLTNVLELSTYSVIPVLPVSLRAEGYG
jgi:hypothetical protein